jgi:hypothetical protein
VLNTVTPTVALLLTCLWQHWLRTRAARYALLSGIAVYGLLFYDPLPLVLGLWFAAFTLRAVSRAEMPPKTLLLHVGGALLVFVTTDVAVRLWVGFDLIATMRHVGADGMAFNAANRPYTVWVWRNLADLFFGVGICQAVLFAATLGYAVCRIGAAGRIDDDPIVVVSLGLAVLVATLDALGVNRGEVVRLWIFLACFLQMPAAYICVRLNNRLALMSILGATLLQAGLGTAMFDFGMP